MKLSRELQEPKTNDAQVIKKNIPQAMDILSDILLNSKYDEFAINRERDVITTEMESVYKESKEELIWGFYGTNFGV